MNATQILPSIEAQTKEPLWQELTEQEQEKIAGGLTLRVTNPYNGQWHFSHNKRTWWGGARAVLYRYVKRNGRWRRYERTLGYAMAR